MRTGLIIGTWIATTVAGFWWYDGRYRLPVAALKPTKPSAAHSLAVPGAAATLVMFYSPGCACSAFALKDVEAITKRYGNRRLAVKLVVEGDGDAPTSYPVIRDQGQLSQSLGIPAAPGAVVLDKNGEVAYVGGFNVARFCNDPQTAYAEQAVVAVLEGRKPARAKGEFYGCALSR